MVQPHLKAVRSSRALFIGEDSSKRPEKEVDGMDEMIEKVTKLIELLWEREIHFTATWTGKTFVFFVSKDKINA